MAATGQVFSGPPRRLRRGTPRACPYFSPCCGIFVDGFG